MRLFNVTYNDISVIYVTAHRCAVGLKKKLDLRSGSQRHSHFVGFFNVPVQAPARGHPFYGYSEKPPHLVALNDTLGIPPGSFSYSNTVQDTLVLYIKMPSIIRSGVYMMWALNSVLSLKVKVTWDQSGKRNDWHSCKVCTYKYFAVPLYKMFALQCSS